MNHCKYVDKSENIETVESYRMTQMSARLSNVFKCAFVRHAAFVDMERPRYSRGYLSS